MGWREIGAYRAYWIAYYPYRWEVNHSIAHNKNIKKEG